MEQLLGVLFIILGLYSFNNAYLMEEVKEYDVLKRTRLIIGGISAIMLGIILLFNLW